MKKLFFALTLVVAMTTAAFADVKVNSRALQHFKTNFKDAASIEWKAGNDYAKASFVWNNQRMEAFYDVNGELIGTSRAITLSNLPIAAQQKLQDKYDGYTATEAIEFDNVKDGLNYYVSLVKDNTKIVLQVSPSGQVEVFKKSHI